MTVGRATGTPRDWIGRASHAGKTQKAKTLQEETVPNTHTSIMLTAREWPGGHRGTGGRGHISACATEAQLELHPARQRSKTNRDPVIEEKCGRSGNRVDSEKEAGATGEEATLSKARNLSDTCQLRTLASSGGGR